MSKREGSRSDVQEEVEVALVADLASHLGTKLTSREISLDGKTVQIDGYGQEATGKVVLAEAFSRVGALKAAQKKKLLADVLKLLLASKLHLDSQGKPRVGACYLIVAGKKAKEYLSNKSWAALAVKTFGIKVHPVELSPKDRRRLLEAQAAQDLTAD